MERSLKSYQHATHAQRIKLFGEHNLDELMQVGGAMMEAGELFESEMKSKHYDSVHFEDDERMKEVGDVVVMLMGYCSLKGYDIEECIEMAALEFCSRDGT